MYTRGVHLPSDPQLLLKLIDEIDSDESDDGWDGYVDEDDEELRGGWDKRHEDYEEFDMSDLVQQENRGDESREGEMDMDDLRDETNMDTDAYERERRE